MSAIRRRSTVHDLASLRLHPDGSRVQNIASSNVTANADSEGVSLPPRKRGTANTRSRLATTTVRDVQGNWIARDAGGRATVKNKLPAGTFRGKDRETAHDAGEEYEPDDYLDSEPRSQSLHSNTDGEDDGEVVKDSRTRKRMKFLHDFSFLDSTPLPSTQPGTPGPSTANSVSVDLLDLPVPSSDLLKYIHYFASEYYAAGGLLYDAGREFRMEKKARKMQKLRHRTLKNMRGRISDVGEDKKSGENEVGVVSEANDPSRELSPREKKSRSVTAKKGTIPNRDMYRAFDGTALMAIGMLLQEYILQMMSNAPPEGWEEEMLKHEANARKVKRTRIRRKRRVTEDKRGVASEENMPLISDDRDPQLEEDPSITESDDVDELASESLESSVE